MALELSPGSVTSSSREGWTRLVARETDGDQTLVTVLLMQGLEVLVLRSLAALGSHIDEQEGLVLQVGQGDLLAWQVDLHQAGFGVSRSSVYPLVRVRGKTHGVRVNVGHSGWSGG